MDQKTIRPFALTLTLLSALARLLPHPPNFTPVGGSTLFGGARLNGWLAYLLPLAVMAATDPLVGGYSPSTPFVYASLLLSVFIGRRLRRNASAVRIGAATLLSSVQFFLITNFAVFLFGYPHTVAGLGECYLLAIPFFGRTLAGDLVTTGALFGAYSLLTRTVARQEALAVA